MEIPEKKYIELQNGEKYAYIEQGERQTGKTFLFIHGNSSSSMHYLPVFNRLKSAPGEALSGKHLIAPDLRGFGDSSYINRFDNLWELAQDIKLFMEALGIKNAHVIGWSTGGGVAMELASRYPSLVLSLFLIEGMSYKGFPLYAKNPDGTYRPYCGKDELALDPVLIAPALAAYENKDISFFDKLWNFSIYTINKPSEEENNLYLNETVKQRNLIDVDWALAVFNMSGGHNGYTQGRGTISNILCPVAVTCAESDKLVPPDTSRENALAIKGAYLLEYKNCGHSPLVDCPDRLAADILKHAGISEGSGLIKKLIDR